MRIPFIDGAMEVMKRGLPSVSTRMTGLPVLAAALARASCSFRQRQFAVLRVSA